MGRDLDFLELTTYRLVLRPISCKGLESSAWMKASLLYGLTDYDLGILEQGVLSERQPGEGLTHLVITGQEALEELPWRNTGVLLPSPILWTPHVKIQGSRPRKGPCLIPRLPLPQCPKETITSPLGQEVKGRFHGSGGDVEIFPVMGVEQTEGIGCGTKS